MHPTKKTLYILIACILSLTAISLAKSFTTKPVDQVALGTSSSTDSQNISQEDFNFITGQGATIPATISDSDNITENFSKELFSKYAAINNGESISEIDAQSLIAEALDSYKSASFGADAHFQIKDVLLTKSTLENLKTFANKFATKDIACTAQIKNVAQSTKDPVKTGNLYKSCAEEYAKIAVIPEISQAYLNLLNTNYNMGEKLIDLKDGDSDPLRALVIVKEISIIDTDRTSAYKYISEFIKSSGIIFSNTDDGKLWLGATK